VVSPAIFPGIVIHTVGALVYGLSVATTLLCTVIIVARIVMLSRIPGFRRPKIGGTAIEIIVESSALYSIFGIAYIPMTIGKFNASSRIATYNWYGSVVFGYTLVSKRLFSLHDKLPDSYL
jgi:hypothetical protein